MLYRNWVLIMGLFFTCSAAGESNMRLLPLLMPRGLESFTLDTQGAAHVAPELWEQTRALEGRTLFVGRGSSLQASRIEVGRNSQGQLSHVIAVAAESPTPGFWEGFYRFFHNSSGKPPAETVITSINSDGKLNFETRCLNGECFVISDRYCREILRRSSAASFDHLMSDIRSCEKLNLQWIKDLDYSGNQKLAQDVFSQSRQLLHSSRLLQPYFKQFSNGYSSYRLRPVDLAKVEAGQTELLWAGEIAKACGHHLATQSLAPSAMSASGTTSPAGAR